MTDKIEPDTPGRKARLMVERMQLALERHQRKEGECYILEFWYCGNCGGDDIRGELIQLYKGAPIGVTPEYDPDNPPKGPVSTPGALKN